MTDERPRPNAWTWPLVSLGILVGCVILGVVLALIFS